MKPLAGVEVVEMAGLGPGPHAGQLLADWGASVTAVSRAGQPLMPVESRGKRSVVLDLKSEGGREAVLRLAERADILVEGYRPGVMERLGLGPTETQARNPRLVYGRMTGWGQTGPWARVAGHDINYIGLSGALLAMGEAGRPPVPPLNLVGDYGGGSLFLVGGVLAALLAARETGKGAVVDVAIVDGTLSLFGLMFSMAGQGAWTAERASNPLDGGAPFYRCYETADGGYMAVGALEPQFFARMLALLDIAPATYGAQHDRAAWGSQHALLARTFAARSRAEWCAVFDGEDACVTPVLSYEEAGEHPHMKARAALRERAGVTHPPVAPRFGADMAQFGDVEPGPVPQPGADTQAVLRELGL